MIPLSMVEKGKKVKVLRFRGGKGLEARLQNLGIMQGAVLTVINNSGGPVIVSRDNSRIVLGKGISHKVIVEYI
ncbi:MAG: hypothetical protein B6D63_06175 [Candidatus Latescibacteria bacterium 4484_7]|nr:MAG: hypothetical protein B6D63_06175 [Candidatus Latescibacteria bacterium 4484_7]RKZ08145.1 MAG: hypothetical protein DRQ05_02010 [bacterium]